MKKAWRTSTLGDTCEMYQPKTISVREMVDSGAYPVFGANGVIGRYDKFNHEEPQLLITCRGATCGSVNVSEPKSWITGNAMVVRPKDSSIDLRFLEYLFRGGIEISKAITGAAQPQITRTNLAPLAICFPPRSEQQRIVELLDEAFAGLATAKSNAEKNVRNVRALFESYLHSLFAQRGPGWVEGELGDQCEFENGDRGTNYPNKSARKATGVPFINAGHLTDDGLDVGSMDFISKERFDLLGGGKVRPGDILFCLRGSLGKCASVGELSLGAIASSLVIIRPRPTILDRFVLAYLRSSLCGEMISRYKNGAAQPNLSASNVKRFVVPFPPLVEQESVVRKLEDFRSEVKRLEGLYWQRLIALEDLKKSLLNQALSGAL